jgi:hypothetical protein
MIRALQILGEIHDITESKTIDVEVILLEVTDPNDNSIWLITECPFCGKHHTHGAGRFYSKSEDYLGGRSPHCEKHENGINDYKLVWNNRRVIVKDRPISAILKRIKKYG